MRICRRLLKGEKMGNIVIIAVLVVIVLLAAKSSMGHFRGEGGCCGGSGPVPKAKRKKLQGETVAEKVIHIQGMHCENCKNSVERAINAIDGASAKVSLKENQAVVVMTRMVSDEELQKAVENQDFKVTGIESRLEKKIGGF